MIERLIDGAERRRFRDPTTVQPGDEGACCVGFLRLCSEGAISFFFEWNYKALCLFGKLRPGIELKSDYSQ